MVRKAYLIKWLSVSNLEEKTALCVVLILRRFTPFRIEDAQYATPSPLITAHKVGVLNEKRCKKQ